MAASSNIYYSPDSLRVSKTVNGETTTHILDGANVVADIQGTSISKYNRGLDLISMEQNGQKGYYVFNGHGDVVQMRNASGEQVYGKRYDAFGVEMENGTSTNPFTNPFGYAGEYTDEESGNIYLRARYYNPSTGRFLSEDPIKDGTNWYIYAGNNPVMYIDPWGLKPGDKFPTLAAAIRDADDYYMDQTIKTDEEMVALIYQDSNGEYYYITARNLAPDKTLGFSVRWSKKPLALFHTHVFYDVNNINDEFSTPGNSTGPNGASDTSFADSQGIPIFVGTPNGKIKMYKPNSNTPKTFKGEGTIDPKTQVYEEIKDSKLWDFIDKNYPTIDKMDIVKAKLKYPDDNSKVLKELGINATPEQIKEMEQ